MENHTVVEHAIKKKQKCSVCDKTFLLKWRLMKHMKGHSQPTKTCNYFINAIECPFEELGCKFQHAHSTNDEKCSQPYKYVEDENATFVGTILMIRKALRSTPYQSTWIGFERVELYIRPNQELEVSHYKVL